MAQFSAEVRYVTAGGSVIFFPAVYISPEITRFTILMEVQSTFYPDFLTILAWKSSSVKCWTNIMSGLAAINSHQNWKCCWWDSLSRTQNPHPAPYGKSRHETPLTLKMTMLTISNHFLQKSDIFQMKVALDKAPRLSTRIDIWILLSDTIVSICQTQPNHIQIVRRQCCLGSPRHLQFFPYGGVWVEEKGEQ